MRTMKSVVVTAVLCRFERTANPATRKNGLGSPRRGDSNFRREYAVYHNPNPRAETPGCRGGNFGNTRDSATLLCRSSLSHPANIEYVGLTSFRLFLNKKLWPPYSVEVRGLAHAYTAFDVLISGTETFLCWLTLSRVSQSAPSLIRVTGKAEA